MTKHTLVVLTNANEGADDAFNDWYTNTHIGDILALEGFTAAQRFKLSETQLAEGDLPYRYLALYEIETDDLAGARAALLEGAPQMEISDAFDQAGAKAWLFSPITERVTAEETAAARATA